MSRPGPWRLGVNLAWMRPGIVGGSEEATVAALLAVAPHLDDAGIEALLFCHPRIRHAHPGLLAGFELLDVGSPDAERVRRVLTENSQLARVARLNRIDLMHHAGGVIPPTYRLPATLTIHDLQPLDMPSNFSATKRRYLATVLGGSARRALRIAVPSQFVKSRVVDRLGIDPERVHVVVWSTPSPVGALSTTPDPNDDPRRLLPETLGPTFLLYPAITYPHKNHLVLLDAFARVVAAARARGGPIPELVLTGAAGPSEQLVLDRIARPDLVGRVHRLGRVPRPVLDALYVESCAVVFPSRYEGFGLPVLEAMVRGAAVIVANAGSLPEVVDDDMIVVDPDDVAGWADAMQSVCDDPRLRQTLVRAGSAAAARFTPDRTAAALVEMWTRALAELT